MGVLLMESKNKRSQLLRFLLESNLIEHISREPTESEIQQTLSFLETGELTIELLQDLVDTYQPGAKLRAFRGMDVIVGSYRPPQGGPAIPPELRRLLLRAHDEREHPYNLHRDYETLHPFTDGNGRSGRALWAYMMIRRKGWESTFGLPFLHRWYYQSLERSRKG